jgi:hypothetical protein
MERAVYFFLVLLDLTYRYRQRITMKAIHEDNLTISTFMGSSLPP